MSIGAWTAPDHALEQARHVGGVVEARRVGDDIERVIGVGQEAAGNLDAHAPEAALDGTSCLEAESMSQVPRRDPAGFGDLANREGPGVLATEVFRRSEDMGAEAGDPARSAAV